MNNTRVNRIMLRIRKFINRTSDHKNTAKGGIVLAFCCVCFEETAFRRQVETSNKYRKK